MRARSLLLVVLPVVAWLGACGGSTDDEVATGGSGAVGTGGVDGGLGGTGGNQEAATCPTDQKQCSKGCESKSDPATGCGSTTCDPCALPHATATCDSQAKCAVSKCDAGWADCNANSVDGCETNLDADKNHCGSCANDCVGQLGVGSICSAGKCEINCCGSDPAMMDCDGNKANCCETNTATDPLNCGSCGNACASGQTCVSSKCQ